MTTNEIERAAMQLITDKIAVDEIVNMDWTVKELISRMGAITGDGVEFYQVCAYETTYRAVKKAVASYEDATESINSKQLTFDGYDHLKKAYTVKRDTRDLVPVTKLTDEELLERADEYEKQSQTLLLHAKEIRAYVKKRQVEVEMITELGARN